jgi:hypothetical protein
LKENLSTQLNLSDKYVNILIRNSTFNNWPSKIKSIKNSDDTDYQSVKDENMENIKKIICNLF